MKPNKIILICLIALMIGGIILAVKDIVKGHCGDSKCTYDVYTKEKVDELLAEVKQNNIFTSTGTITIPANEREGRVKILLPEGFTTTNSVPISVGYSIGDNEHAFWYFGSLQNTDSECINTSYVIYINDEPNVSIQLGVANETDITANYKVVFMKIA